MYIIDSYSIFIAFPSRTARDMRIHDVDEDGSDQNDHDNHDPQEAK